MRKVSQPPSLNFSTVVMTRMVRHMHRPVPCTMRFLSQALWGVRSPTQKRPMPISVSEKVRNTLMA